jgi:hypothetical protein
MADFDTSFFELEMPKKQVHFHSPDSLEARVCEPTTTSQGVWGISAGDGG